MNTISAMPLFLPSRLLSVRVRPLTASLAGITPYECAMSMAALSCSIVSVGAVRTAWKGTVEVLGPMLGSGDGESGVAQG